ncbi:hypothetical protein MUK70_12850 [Dyadobacter chenwenxiniae]|uniref:Uncharacterized protein n=1 Tax=Dyadobacter chenwenxiniae TaxID=2906456 RepID=A0A9X1TJJ0_9BACT|nr:hypothetical protein [Dyadobacter chenwenxiniae]MCF0060133.1 hypothetical protein [Dyadobacter chenwenxiniae]UON85870.1 hypothetical protein MUK70_12850 [Dyadobacter chenwenxiniae]
MSTETMLEEAVAGKEAREVADKKAIIVFCKSSIMTRIRGRNTQWDIEIGGTDEDREKQLAQIIKAYRAAPAALHTFKLKNDADKTETIEAQIVYISRWKLSLVEPV